MQGLILEFKCPRQTLRRVAYILYAETLFAESIFHFAWDFASA